MNRLDAKGDDRCSERQILVVLAVALAVPAVALPGRIAEAAGGAAPLAPLLALPFALGLAFLLGRLGDLPDALVGAWGRRLGGGLMGAYLLWCVGLLALYLRGCASRLVLTGSGTAGARVTVLVAAALIFWMARGKLCRFCRGVELFYLAMAVGLAACLALGLGHVRAENLLPPPAVGDLLRGTVPALSVVSLGALGGCLAGRVTPRPGDGRRRYIWVTAFCVVLALITLMVVGRLGPALTAALPAPFFTVVQGLGVKGAFQRVEGLAAALWLLGDLALLGLLVFAGRRLTEALFGGRPRRWAVPVLLAAGLAGAAWLTDGLAVFLRGGVTVCNLSLGFLVPLATWVKLKGKNGK